jgi:hypothetical protein
MPPYTNVHVKIPRHAVRNVERNYLDLMLGDAMNVRARVESGKSTENLPIHWHLPERLQKELFHLPFGWIPVALQT